jgi:hypothetical protein
VKSTSGQLLEHPVVAAAAERQPLVAAAPADAEHCLVVLGAARVDDLDQRQLLALPPAVGGVRDGEVLVRPREVALEAAAAGLWRRRAYMPPIDRTITSRTKTPKTIASQVGMRRDYSSTSRERMCAPTLRLTRWSALPTVLQSQPSCSPVPV